MSKIFESIVLKITADTSGLDKNLDDAEDSMDDFTDSTDESNSSLVAWGAAAATAAAGGLALLVKGQADAIQETDAYAKRLGIATQELLALQTAAGKFNIEAEDVNEGLKNMVERLGEASLEGQGATFDAITELGLSLEDLNALAPEKQFIAIADALSKVNDVSRRTFLEMEIGQEEFFKMGELIQEGEEGITALIKEARRLNGDLSDLDIQNIRAMEAAAGETQAAFNSIFREIAANVAPVMKELFNISSDLFVLFREEALPIIGEWSSKVSNLFLDFAEKILPSVLTGAKGVFTGVSQFIEALATVAGQVFGLIGTGWGLLGEEITGEANWIKTITNLLAVGAQAWPEIIAKPFLIIGKTISNFLASLEDRFFSTFDAIRKEGLSVANALNDITGGKLGITDLELEAGILAIDEEAAKRESEPKTAFTNFFKDLGESQGDIIESLDKFIQEIADKTALDQEGFESSVGEAINKLRKAITGVGSITAKITDDEDDDNNNNNKPSSNVDKLISAAEAGSAKSIDLINSRQLKQGNTTNEKILAQNEKQTKTLEKIEKKPTNTLQPAQGF